VKGVALTTTGEPLAMLTLAELAKLFVNTPKVGLNITKIFEDGRGDSEDDKDEEEVACAV
jgi:NIMA (never in mitosis gene a)-related kinase 2